MLEPSWANLVTFGALLAPSGRLPGPCWVRFGAILGGILCYFGLMVAPFWRPFVVSELNVLSKLLLPTYPKKMLSLKVSGPRGASAGTRSANNFLVSFRHQQKQMTVFLPRGSSSMNKQVNMGRQYNARRVHDGADAHA